MQQLQVLLFYLGYAIIMMLANTGLGYINMLMWISCCGHECNPRYIYMESLTLCMKYSSLDWTEQCD